MLQPTASPAGADDPRALRTRAGEAMNRAVENLARLQDADGGWAGDYGGPMFLLPMYLALCHAAHREAAAGGLSPDRRDGIVRYFSNVQRPDGSVGLHA